MSRRVLIVVLLAFGSFLGAAGTASAHANVRGVWMAGPGCTSFEWFQHPTEFPYFCDGAAIVEGVHWSSWGASKATASAIMNEADPGPGESMASAPRTHRPVTVVASQIKICGGRRAYTRIVITFDEAVNGVKTLHFGTFLPKCSAPPQRGTAAAAPCTKEAINAGLQGSVGRLLGNGFACAGRFAYADVKIDDYEAVMLLRSDGGHWKLVDRTRYCEAGAVPAKIRYFACEVS